MDEGAHVEPCPNGCEPENQGQQQIRGGSSDLAAREKQQHLEAEDRERGEAPAEACKDELAHGVVGAKSSVGGQKRGKEADEKRACDVDGQGPPRKSGSLKGEDERGDPVSGDGAQGASRSGRQVRAGGCRVQETCPRRKRVVEKVMAAVATQSRMEDAMLKEARRHPPVCIKVSVWRLKEDTVV